MTCGLVMDCDGDGDGDEQEPGMMRLLRFFFLAKVHCTQVPFSNIFLLLLQIQHITDHTKILPVEGL